MNTQPLKDEYFMRLPRDYASLRRNYWAVHREPVPDHLQREIHALSHDMETRNGS